MEKFIALIMVKIAWFFTWPLPVKKNKILFISYFESKLTGNFKLISKELKKSDVDYEMVFMIRKFKNTLWAKFKYLFNFAVQTYHINTSAVVLLDGNNFPVSNIKKKEETKVIQIWHACGGIKKFGCDINRRFPIKNYDYVYVAGEAFIESFSTAFDISKDKIIPLGVAKTDILYDKDKMEGYKNEMYRRYPVLKGKKVILYAPTFRGDGAFELKYVNLDMAYLSRKLGEEYAIIYKMHPFLERIALDKNTSENIINANKVDIYKLFSVADVLISDYSAIIFDYSILEKPMLLYVPDLEEYERDRGFYYDYSQLAPGPVCRSEKEIINTILTGSYDLEKVRGMKHKFFDHHDGKSAKRVAEHIEKLVSQGKAQAKKI
jgi:CDP-ribitol ribitolphosphotransferase